jgi:hypothetical protein
MGLVATGLLALLIQNTLKSDERLLDRRHAAELSRRIVHGVELEFQQVGEFLLIEFPHALPDILRQNKVQERLELAVVTRENCSLSLLDPGQARDRRQRKRDIGQNIEHIAVLGVDHAADLDKLVS